MPSRGRRLPVAAVVAFLLASRAAAQTAPSLGTAASFAVLGGSSVDNSGTTRVSSNVGVTPGTTLRGFPPGTIVLGDLFIDNGTGREAHRDSAAAYADLAAQSCVPLPGDAPPPGVYCVTSPLPSTLTLTPSGNGPPVWIFRTASLTTADNSRVLLRSANYNNVFWQVTGLAVLGASSAFAGTIIATGDITLKRDVSMNGRALSLNGAVTLDADDVSCCDPIEFAPLSLPAAKVGVAYNQGIALSGGMAPYQVSLFDGTLPPGLTPASGALSGTPTAEGTYTFTLLAVDARGCSSIHTYTIAVCGTIVVSFDPKPNAKACQPFQRQVIVTGCSPPYKIVVTGLPEEFTNTGDLISGTPTTPGCFPITIEVTDANGMTQTLATTLCVDCGLMLPDLNPPTATACMQYTANLTPSCGKSPYVFTPIDFPPWLPGPSELGIIAGIPPASGPVTFTVKVVDANGCIDTRTYTLNVAPRPPPPSLPTIIPNGFVCTPYDYGPIPGVLVDEKALPPELHIIGNRLTGIPKVAGTFHFAMKEVPFLCSADTQAYQITIDCPPLELAPIAPPLQIGVLMNPRQINQLLTPPFCLPFDCRITAGTLPTGLSLDDCVLHGIAPLGAYDFTVTATAGSSGCSVSQHYTGTVLPRPPTPACDNGMITITPPPLPGGTVGVLYSQMLSANGGTMPYTFIVPLPPAPPPGITLASNGTLSGVPTAPGRYNFGVRVTDAKGVCHSEVYTIVIGPHPPDPLDIPALSTWALVLLGFALAAMALVRRSS